MNKSLMIILALLIVLSLAACGNENSNLENAEDVNNQVSESNNNNTNVNIEIVDGNVVMTEKIEGMDLVSTFYFVNEKVNRVVLSATLEESNHAQELYDALLENPDAYVNIQINEKVVTYEWSQEMVQSIYEGYSAEDIKSILEGELNATDDSETNAE